MDDVSDDRNDIVDLALFDNEWRRECDDVAGDAHEQASLQALHEDIISPGSRRTVAASEFDGADEAKIANVDHVWRALQRVKSILPCCGKRCCSGQKVFVLIDFQSGDAGGAGHWMAGIGVAVEKLDLVFRAVHQAFVNRTLGKNGAHRNCAVGDAFRGADEIGNNAEIIRCKRFAEATEAGDDFIEDQKDAVLIGNSAQPLKISLWWKDDAS